MCERGAPGHERRQKRGNVGETSTARVLLRSGNVRFRHCKYVISMTAVAALWGHAARADDPPPPAAQTPSDAPETPPEAPAAGAHEEPDEGPAPVTAVPAPVATPPVSITAVPDPASDADLARVSQGEAIEIFDERPDKPFDRDTEVRLTGEQLAARGAVDLATALALLPDVSVRDAGRGGFNIDIRGARKGAVSVLIDGPGGPGGVIEVHTRDAIGRQVVIGRITADSLPSFGMTGTARVALIPH